MKKIDIISGVRPDIIRGTQLLKTLSDYDSNWSCRLVHTGQHFDHELAGQYVEELNSGSFLNLGEDGHGTGMQQLSSLLLALDSLYAVEVPDLVILIGNSRSTLAAALVAKERKIRTAHIDAGVRSFDRTRHEENHDMLVDRLADYLFTATEDAVINLIREGYENTAMVEVGNVRADSVFMNLGFAEDSHVLDRYGLESGNYSVVSLHHQETFADLDYMHSLFRILEDIAETQPVLFIVHPKLHFLLDELRDPLENDGNIQMITSQPYRDFLKLLKEAAMVFTDSQGIQEETSILGVQCLTLGATTNRLVTLSRGSNSFHGFDLESLKERLDDIAHGHLHPGTPINGWEGKSAQRIAEFIAGII